MELSFSEIFAIAVIAFLVLGPEELIRKSHQFGKMWAKLRTQINNYRIMAEDEVLSEKDLSPEINLRLTDPSVRSESDKNEEN